MIIEAVIVAYNEEENLGELFSRLIDALRKLSVTARFLFVVDGNHRGVEVLEELAHRENIKDLRVIYSPEPVGAGRACRIGFAAISKDCDYVLTMDADLNHQPEELGCFFAALKNSGIDIIIGSRYIKGAAIHGMPAWKFFLSKRVNDFLSVFSHLKVRDKTSGYRLIRREVIERISPLLIAEGFDFYVEFLARALRRGYTMREVPITFINRKRGFSKMKKFATLVSYLKLFFRIKMIEKGT